MLHEFSTTSQIVDLALREANQRGAERIVEVVLQIGKMTLLSLEQVRFSYEVLTEHTIAKGSVLTVEEVPGEIRCSSCGFTGPVELEGYPYFHVAFPILSCPKCGGAAEITGGNDCIVKSIRMLGPRTSAQDGPSGS